MVSDIEPYHIGSIEVSGKILRKCRTCRETKELNTDNFIKRNTENGWRGECRICYNKSTRSKQECSKTEIERGRKYRERVRKEKPLECIYKIAKGNAKRTYKHFDLSLEDVKEKWTLQDGLCFYTGKPMAFEIGLNDSVSIDRKDSSIGYVKDNIVLCRYKINVMKNDLSVADFLQVAKDVIQTMNNEI